MTLTPLIEAGFIIQSHILAALIAVVIGPFALLRRRRDWRHRTLGYVWVTAMGWTALSSFRITSFGLLGPFSPIHLLSVLTLWTLVYALRQIRAGNVVAHQLALQNLYWRGLLIAGLFTLMPGRTLSNAFLADAPALAWVIIGLGLTAILGPLIWRLVRTHFALERPARLG